MFRVLAGSYRRWRQTYDKYQIISAHVDCDCVARLEGWWWAAVCRASMSLHVTGGRTQQNCQALFVEFVKHAKTIFLQLEHELQLLATSIPSLSSTSDPALSWLSYTLNHASIIDGPRSSPTIEVVHGA